VAVIALATVGREVARLGRQPRQAHFDIEEAVDWIADHLPFEATASLSYDDVRELIRFHFEYLRDRGVPRTRDTVGRGHAIVVDDDESVAYLLLRADQEGLELTDEQAFQVIGAELAYFAAIGAIGPPVEGPADPPELA
jgi:hypothetical protein